MSARRKTNSASEARSVCTSSRFLRASEHKEQKGEVPTGISESGETTCLHVKQISEDEEKAASLNSNWSRASESMSRPRNRRPAAAIVRPGAEPAGADPTWEEMKSPGRSFRPAGG